MDAVTPELVAARGNGKAPAVVDPAANTRPASGWVAREGVTTVVRDAGARGGVEEKKLSGFAVQKNLSRMSCGMKVPLERSATCHSREVPLVTDSHNRTQVSKVLSSPFSSL